MKNFAIYQDALSKICCRQTGVDRKTDKRETEEEISIWHVEKKMAETGEKVEKQPL